MAILITGGTGKTGLRLARLLQNASIPFLIASRKGAASTPAGMPAVTFDWTQPATYAAPFAHTFPNNEKIKAVYLISPSTKDPSVLVNAFVDVARTTHGVKRFVFLTGSSCEKGGPHVGAVWQHLDDIGVEYTVLRATWFMENFSQWQHRETITKEAKIYTFCADGKAPFISAADIAAVAFHCLTDAKAPSHDVRVLGPKLLTHDEVAATISKAVGRTITHVRMTEEETVARYIGVGMPEVFAKFMTRLEASTAAGAEDTTDDAVERITGRPPKTFAAWAEENKKCWD
ncbi:hypothetical protein C8J57DRAFT_1096375 [Mycena rebaudengoi]|nr:hypothetical protein C8J57DRAFT_1096375 [Mycena rebaudengoi]